MTATGREREDSMHDAKVTFLAVWIVPVHSCPPSANGFRCRLHGAAFIALFGAYEALATRLAKQADTTYLAVGKSQSQGGR